MYVHLSLSVVMFMASSMILLSCLKSAVKSPFRTIFFWEITLIEATTLLKQFVFYLLWKLDTKIGLLF